MAATIFVDGTNCTLVDAITAANSNAPAGGCTAGIGADTLSLFGSPFGIIPPLTTVNNNTYGPTGLPVVTSEITISGFFKIITRDSSAPQFRILAVSATGNLTLQEAIVSGGIARSGGGIFARGPLTLYSSTVSGNTAESAGGGISSDAPLTLDNSTVSGNSAGGEWLVKYWSWWRY